MKLTYLRQSIIVCALFFVACSKEESPLPELAFTYDFNQGLQGWIGGFSDYPVGEDAFYELAFYQDSLPAEMGISQNAFRIHGHNHSDDLFMFLKRELVGLKASTRYEARIEVELASQYPENSIGVGGSPGGSVYFKVGASAREPKVEEVNLPGFSGLGLNIDKGNQSNGGADMVVAGTIGIEGDEFEYRLINRDNQSQPIIIETGANGEAWAIVGTDSGFEGPTTLYYTSIKVVMKELGPA